MLKDLLKTGNTANMYKLKPNTKNGNRIIVINNYPKYKWVECSPEDKDWLNGYKNKTPIYSVYKRPTSKQGTHTD